MTQVSGYISDESKMIFEDYAKHSGQKKGFILEQALLHYISAQQELPSDIIIPLTITVSKEVFESVIIADKESTPALIEMMRANRD